MLVSVKNERGEEVSRQIVGVGALQPGEARTFSFAVEVFAPDAITAVKPEAGDSRLVTAAPLTTQTLPSAPSPAAKKAALKGVNRS